MTFNYSLMMLLFLIKDKTALAMAVTPERGQNILNIMIVNCNNIKSNVLFINEMLFHMISFSFKNIRSIAKK
jgi:hypothetical protein